MYAHLDDQPSLFNVTPGKNCRLFPYLWTKECADLYGSRQLTPENNPYLCRAMGPVDPAQAYNGLPAPKFKYTLAGDPKNANAPIEEPPVL